MAVPNLTESTAYHESGHAVVAHHLGVSVVDVTLRPGRTRFAHVIEDDATVVAVYLAGHAAERIAHPDAVTRWSGSDRAFVDRAAFNLTGDLDALDVLVDETNIRVSEVLVEHWRSVERVAYALLVARPECLTAADVRRLVGSRCWRATARRAAHVASG